MTRGVSGIIFEVYVGELLYDKFALVCKFEDTLQLIKLFHDLFIVEEAEGGADDSGFLKGADDSCFVKCKSKTLPGVECSYRFNELWRMDMSAMLIMYKVKKYIGLDIVNKSTLDDYFDENPVCFREFFRSCPPKHTAMYVIDGYSMSHFFKTLKNSRYYIYSVMLHHYREHRRNKKCHLKGFKNSHFLTVRIDLKASQQDIIDYAWNLRLKSLLFQRRELDAAMAWLSTLGGAFSALGDHKKDFALVAGDISFKQLKIALRLGDPMIELRCKLYYSLSLIQRGSLKRAKQIIKKQYNMAKNSVVVDVKAVSMCLGIWSRLQYEYKKRKMSV